MSLKQKINKILLKCVIINLVLGFFLQAIATFPLYAFVVNEESIPYVNLNNTNEVEQYFGDGEKYLKVKVFLLCHCLYYY